MGKKSRILLFILVNILISAAITLTVLWLWERAHPRYSPEIGEMASTSIDAFNPSLQTLEDEPPSDQAFTLTNDDIEIAIRAIVGAGDLAVEYVEIINQGQNPADLSNWQLIDEDGNQFTFPALILNANGAVKVLSKTGTNTVIELYWQANAPIWQSGETAQLVNAIGEVVTTYSIP